MHIHITEHASWQIGMFSGSRTSLSPKELRALIKAGAYVRFATERDTRFDLIWDHHKETAVILLTTTGRNPNETAIISIWPITFVLTVKPPSEEQIDSARTKSEEYWSRMSLK
jgi:hypothetical protein